MERVRRVLGGLRHWVGLIPGFRRRSESSMLIAGTYYAVAVALLLWRWGWGLFLLGLPFLVFSAIALYESGTIRRPLVVLTAAGGALVCLGLGAALAQGLPTRPVALAQPAVAMTTGAASPSVGTARPTPATAVPTQGLAAVAVTLSAQSTTAQGAFVASGSGSIYHRADCASAARILAANRLWFDTASDAEAAGYRPCAKCHPGENGETTPTAPTAPPMATAVRQGVTSSPGTTEGAFVASGSGSVYHRADCASAARILAANRLWFDTPVEAEAAGYRPCAKCHPDE